MHPPTEELLADQELLAAHGLEPPLCLRGLDAAALRRLREG